MSAIQSRRLPIWISVLAALVVMLLLWQLMVSLTQVPAFIFPAPMAVLGSFFSNFTLLAHHASITLIEILLGLLLGTMLGVSSAITLTLWTSARRWVLPLLVVSQSLPVFALAPLLTLWFGYGMGSKVVMATLIIFFPVTVATFDGLRHTSDAMIDLARTLNASPLAILVQIRLPAALPSISSGIRVATSVAPIGAVVGEWVGSSKGLGYLMLQANGRMQTDLMFAALLCLCLVAYALYHTVNLVLDRALYWQHDSLSVVRSFKDPTTSPSTRHT